MRRINQGSAAANQYRDNEAHYTFDRNTDAVLE